MSGRAALAVSGAALAACPGGTGLDLAPRPIDAPDAVAIDAGARPGDPGSDAGEGSDTAEESAPRPPRSIGPFELPYAGKRTVFFVVPPTKAPGRRLLANLHGMCNPPGYACGYWTHAGSERGFLVCPTGDGTCGPAAYNAPTWNEPAAKIDEDLERAIAVVDEAYAGEMTREGAVLTGFSKGAYAAVEIASKHPGRWPYLVLNEANVRLTEKGLRAAGVRAVALIAGENGGEIAGERATAAALARQGYPARVWVMPKAGHYYSANIDDIMGEAVDWVLAQDSGSPSAAH
jgi:predicted esterase